ncbi:MAG: alpha/beta hydrolase fold domain-containing protein [Microthrixaceae bacterium]
MDPRVEELLPVIEAFGFASPTIEEVRARFRATASAFPAPEGVQIENIRVGGRDALRVRPDSGAVEGRILHLHGGGFVIGDLDVQLSMPARLALATGAEVVSLDYRIAPEDPCPAAVEDTVAAYEELLADGPVDALAGESAGGALAVLAAVALRDRGTALPAVLLALSPWFDIAGTSARYADASFVDPVLPRSFLPLASNAWRGTMSVEDPRVNPLHATLGGLPPTLLHVGGAEMVLEDSERLASRLAAAGVEVELRVWPEMIHVFAAYPNLVPEADQSLGAAAAFLAARRRP